MCFASCTICQPVKDLLYCTGWDGSDSDLLKLGIEAMHTGGWGLVDTLIILLIVDAGTLCEQ